MEDDSSHLVTKNIELRYKLGLAVECLEKLAAVNHQYLSHPGTVDTCEMSCSGLREIIRRIRP